MIAEHDRARDDAARVAEWLLDCHNSDYMEELALDVLSDYVGGIDVYLSGGYTAGLRDPRKRLAWALTLTERRDDLASHEERLLDLAWEQIRQDAIDREWELMGR